MERNIQRSFIIEIPKRFKIQSKEVRCELVEKFNMNTETELVTIPGELLCHLGQNILEKLLFI